MRWIASYVEYVNENKDVIFDTQYYTDGGWMISQLIICGTQPILRNVMSFANNDRTKVEHMSKGFRTALTRVINYALRQATKKTMKIT